MKNVLDVGQCDYDHANIRRLIESLGATVLRAHGEDDALEIARQTPLSLILVNRIFDRDRFEGLQFIKTVRSNPTTSHLPVMLVSNYEEAQQSAVAAGALRGFGKDNLLEKETREKLRAIVDPAEVKL